MRSRSLRLAGVVLVPFALVVIGGCGGNDLAQSATIELPDGTTQDATLGSGVVSFANSRWQFFQTGPSSQGAAFATIRFGPDGELEAFEENTIASNIFGNTILFDGERHPTNQQGLSYEAGTYGAATADARGFAFEGAVTAFAAGLQAASATASAQGEFQNDDINTVRGTFEFSSRVTLLDIPEGNIDMSFEFIGQRVEE